MRPMRKSTRERVITVMALVLVISIGFLVPKAAAQSDKYPKMAPVDQYLMERNAEILLARSAAGRPSSRRHMRSRWSSICSGSGGAVNGLRAAGSARESGAVTSIVNCKLKSVPSLVFTLTGYTLRLRIVAGLCPVHRLNA